jgi:hypothetical protein
MPISFPLNPTLNQVYTYNGLSWRWDGEGWEPGVAIGATGATGVAGPVGATGPIGATGPAGTDATVATANTAPVSPTNGKLWFDTDAGDLYAYFANSWVMIGSGGSGGAGGVTAVYDVASTSTGYFDLPSGNTAQRPASPSTGAIRYNSTTGFAEVYTAVGWGSFGAQPPSISTVSPVTYNGESGTQFTINGANFTNDVSVYFVTNGGAEYMASIVSYVNASQIIATTPRDFSISDEPLDVKLVQTSGVVTKIDVIDCGGSPTWTTAAGTLATINDRHGNYSPIATVVATDPDAGATITYAVTAGSLPPGTSLNSSTGQITGDPTDVVAQTTSNFTITATDNAGNTSDRAFSIVVNLTLDGSSSARAAESAESIKTLLPNSNNGFYWIKQTGATAYQHYCVFKNQAGTAIDGGAWTVPMVFGIPTSNFSATGSTAATYFLGLCQGVGVNTPGRGMESTRTTTEVYGAWLATKRTIWEGYTSFVSGKSSVAGGVLIMPMININGDGGTSAHRLIYNTSLSTHIPPNSDGDRCDANQLFCGWWGANDVASWTTNNDAVPGPEDWGRTDTTNSSYGYTGYTPMAVCCIYK